MGVPYWASYLAAEIYEASVLCFYISLAQLAAASGNGIKATRSHFESAASTQLSNLFVFLHFTLMVFDPIEKGKSRKPQRVSIGKQGDPET